VYVHFPWCLQKCPYCDFLSIAAEPARIPHVAYADAVLSELARRAHELSPGPLGSIFFGGGTPSLWEPKELGRVLHALLAAFPADAGGVEITVECNPSSFDADRARALIDLGVNRVSIGVQGLDSERLRFLGRLHDVDSGLRAVRDAIEAGVPRVSADLIFGVVGQSAEAAAAEATRVAELGPSHVSAYALTIEPGTQFGALARKGKLPLLGEDVVADSFLAVEAALENKGFVHYEISNYARDGHVARHNIGYWRGADYLGLGTGAWGTYAVGQSGRRPAPAHLAGQSGRRPAPAHLAGQSGRRPAPAHLANGRRIRYRNTPSPERYLGGGRERWATVDLGSTGELISEVETIEPETAFRERLMLGLRLKDGLDLDLAGAELGVAAWTAARERSVERLVDRGRLKKEGARLWIPKSAWLFADGTISELM
jgi:oxygen-independent coproporphyrinogen-3 oxidase